MNWIFQLPLEPSQELELDLNISLKFISLARDLVSTIASQKFPHSTSSGAPLHGSGQVSVWLSVNRSQFAGRIRCKQRPISCTSRTQSSFQINRIERFLQKRMDINSSQVVRYCLKIIGGKHNRLEIGPYCPQSFDERRTVTIAKMIVNNRHPIRVETSSSQSFPRGAAAVEGIPATSQKGFQRTSQWSFNLNKQQSLFLHSPLPHSLQHEQAQQHRSPAIASTMPVNELSLQPNKRTIRFVS